MTEQKLKPWWTFVEEHWQRTDGETFLERRKKVAEQWKRFTDNERMLYDRSRHPGVGSMEMAKTLGPDDPKWDLRVGVYRVYYGTDSVDGKTEQWWNNAVHLLPYGPDDLGVGYANESYEMGAWPWYSFPAILDGVTPQAFLQQVFADRYDFVHVGYDLHGNIVHTQFKKVALADEITSKTGMLRCLDIDEESEEITTDVRLPVWNFAYCQEQINGQGKALEAFAVDFGCDKWPDDITEADEEWVFNLRRPLREVFLERIKKNPNVGEDEIEQVTDEALNDIKEILQVTKEQQEEAWGNDVIFPSFD